MSWLVALDSAITLASAPSLSLAMVPAAPTSAETPEKFFNDLADKFGFDHRVAKYLWDTEGLAILDDFARYVTDEEHLAAKVIEKIADLSAKGRQISRLRMA